MKHNPTKNINDGPSYLSLINYWWSYIILDINDVFTNSNQMYNIEVYKADTWEYELTIDNILVNRIVQVVIHDFFFNTWKHTSVYSIHILNTSKQQPKLFRCLYSIKKEWKHNTICINQVRTNFNSHEILLWHFRSYKWQIRMLIINAN